MRRINTTYVMLLLYTVFSSQVVYATPVVNITFIIDKAPYKDVYAVGVNVYSRSQLTFAGVQHNDYSWELKPLNGSWFNWDNETQRNPLASNSLFDKYVVTATDNSGSLNQDIFLPTDIVLDFVTGLNVSMNSNGYQLSMNQVAGADYYSLWVYDKLTGQYVTGSNKSDPSQFATIPYGNLMPGRTYLFYGEAERRFSCCAYDLRKSSVFRSYDYVLVTAVPEPATLLLLGVGGVLIRKFNRKS
jgi:hypothetical protein